MSVEAFMLRTVFAKIGVINWKTTGSAVIAIAGLAVNIQVAWKAKDFMAVVNNAQMVMLNLGLIATALGLLGAKDSNVTGAGTQAKAVDSSGVVTNVEGEKVGKQPAA
jgi:hypothetical protein